MATSSDFADLSKQMTIITDALFAQGDRHDKLVQDCHQQLKTMQEEVEKKDEESKQKASDSKKVSTRNERIQAVGKAVNEAVNIVDAIRNEDVVKGFQAGMALISSLAALAGPYGVAISAVCTVLSTIFGMLFGTGSKKESVLSQMRTVIKEELQQFKMELLKDRGAGLAGLGEALVDELNFYLKELRETGETTYRKKGFDPSRLDDLYEYMSELKQVAEDKIATLAEEGTDKTFNDRNPRFRKLESYSEILKDKTKKERETSAQQCLTCLVGYANIATLYIMLLTLHEKLSTFTLGDNLGLINDKLEREKRQAKELFSFFSDIEMLGPAGWWEGKLRVMVEYRKNPHFLAPIERFQQLVGLSIAPYTADEANYALNLCLALRAHSTISPLDPFFSKPTAGEEHFDKNYFCVVNNTKWPVCIFQAGKEKGRDFKLQAEVRPNECFIDPSAIPSPLIKAFSNPYQKFYASGVFTIGESRRELEKMRNVKFIEFDFSHDCWASAKVYFMLQPAENWRARVCTKPVLSYDKKRLETPYQPLTYTPDDEYDRAKSFTYNGKFYLVKGELKRKRDHGKEYRLYRFIIEEFDHEKLKRQTNKAFVTFMNSKKSFFGPPPGHFASKFH